MSSEAVAVSASDGSANAPTNGNPAPADTVPAHAEPSLSTSEANIAAADPNTQPDPSLLPSDKKENDAEVDVLAADLTEGAVSGATVIAPDSSATPSSTKKGKPEKRRSSIVPEHKSKKAGKKREVVLNLDCKPGDYFFARMKGHPEWPSIIADEEMLPDQILGSRPVTARRHDYTYREDYADGGKNVKDRTYPVMFLGTNEFAWMVNSDLRKLSEEDVQESDKIKGAKKALLDAYKVAREFHTLEHFKSILFNFEAARAQEEQAYAEKVAAAEARDAKRAERAEKAEKKAKRKSTAGADDDTEMVDGDDSGKTPKKRKKPAVESDVDEKPAKTPKIKLNSSKSDGESAKKTKAKSTKAKAKEEPQISEQEIAEKKEKSVLYLRHKLQKGFLQTTAPQEGEMAAMASHFETLQQYKVLEVGIIKKTKIHKVLKAILKLDSVPLDDKYGFKKQSNELLQGWNKILSDEPASPGATNGHTDAQDGSPKESVAVEPAKTEDAEVTKDVSDKPASEVDAPAEAPKEDGPSAAKDTTDRDVTMTEDSKPASEETPAVPASEAPIVNSA